MIKCDWELFKCCIRFIMEENNDDGSKENVENGGGYGCPGDRLFAKRIIIK